MASALHIRALWNRAKVMWHLCPSECEHGVRVQRRQETGKDHLEMSRQSRPYTYPKARTVQAKRKDKAGEIDV